MWFIGVEVEQEKSALPLKKNPGSAPGLSLAERWTITEIRRQLNSVLHCCCCSGNLAIKR